MFRPIYYVRLQTLIIIDWRQSVCQLVTVGAVCVVKQWQHRVLAGRARRRPDDDHHDHSMAKVSRPEPFCRRCPRSNDQADHCQRRRICRPSPSHSPSSLPLPSSTAAVPRLFLDDSTTAQILSFFPADAREVVVVIVVVLFVVVVVVVCVVC